MDANIFNIEILGCQAGWPITWMLSEWEIGDRCRLPHSIVSHLQSCGHSQGMNVAGLCCHRSSYCDGKTLRKIQLLMKKWMITDRLCA